jgi:hypothetical protein
MCKKEWLLSFLMLSSAAFSAGDYLKKIDSETVLCSKEDLLKRVEDNEEILFAASRRDRQFFIKNFPDLLPKDMDAWEELFKSEKIKYQKMIDRDIELINILNEHENCKKEYAKDFDEWQEGLKSN